MRLTVFNSVSHHESLASFTALDDKVAEDQARAYQRVMSHFYNQACQDVLSL